MLKKLWKLIRKPLLLLVWDLVRDKVNQELAKKKP
jgi:hypothetical protein